MARYTTGTPLGIKVRSKFGDNERVVIAAALDQRLVDDRAVPLLRRDRQQRRQDRQRPAVGEAARRPGPRDRRCRAQYGAQDHALDSLDPLWFAGVDLLGALRRRSTSRRSTCRASRTGESADRIYDPQSPPVRSRSEARRLPRGRLDGDAAHRRVRAAARCATRWSGWAIPTAPGTGATGSTSRSPGAPSAASAAVINEHIVVKAEYLHNGEYGGIPQIANDVFTSSLVLIY